MWQWKSSLNVANGLGQPLPVPNNVRLYYLSGASHVATGQGMLVTGLDAGPAGACEYGLQRGAPLNHTFRALVVAMDAWVDRGVPPPRSNYPRLENGTLVPLAQYRASFPTIPGVVPSVVHNEIDQLDFGPRFGLEGGLQELLPPSHGLRYQVFVPRADGDGNDVEGVRQMEVRVPLGTNTGWNVRTAPRAPDLCGLSGAYFPFARTLQERLTSGDSRRSLQERYGSQAGFIEVTDRSAELLVKQGFMLPEDAAAYRAAARARVVVP
jgi:hypothetical protein